jgi:hypothetical protein
MAANDAPRRQSPVRTSERPAVKVYQPKRIVSDAVLAVADAATPEEFLAQLGALRESLRLSYRKIDARVAEKGMSRSTAWNMLNGDALPSRKHLQLFLQACKVTPTEMNLWLRERDRLAASATTELIKQPDTAASTSIQQLAADTPASTSTASDDAPEHPPTNPAHPSAAHLPSAAPPMPASVLRSRNLHLIGALSVLVAVISASAIAMWVTHVSIEVITLTYGLILICIAAWTAVNHALISRIPPPPPLPHPPPNIDFYTGQPRSHSPKKIGPVRPDNVIGDLPKCFPPVIER